MPGSDYLKSGRCQYQIIRTIPKTLPTTGTFIIKLGGGKADLVDVITIQDGKKTMESVGIEGFNFKKYPEPRFVELSAAKLLNLDEKLVWLAEHPVKKRPRGCEFTTRLIPIDEDKWAINLREIFFMLEELGWKL